ncbi:hypothetical protein BYT27DRAFT_7113037 [Phlegmacium glaucopus]|nr:hypothetical protein BYT27DRAFT_7113037 [Phlegmacium glaucopus]
MEQCSTTEICGARRKAEDEPGPIKIIKSSIFWFEDGNVVLQAMNPCLRHGAAPLCRPPAWIQGLYTQFRIHRSVLSMHSPIFRDMFACSKPENGPIIDGCPLIHLTETSECLSNFVKILYNSIKVGNPISRIYNLSTLISVSVLKAMLHFGRKYEMKKLRREAVYCLTLEFPSTLHRWSNQTFGEVIHGIEESPSTLLFEILHMAHEHSITSILPALYLRICLSHDAKQITEAFQYVENNSPLINKLLINCLSGREHLHRSVSSLTLAWSHGNKSSPDGCQTTQKCQEKRSMLITKIWNNNVQFSLKFAMQKWEHLSLGEGLCSTCLRSAKVAYGKARVANWEQLKTYFGLCDLEDKPESDSDSSASDESDADVEELVK